MFVILVWFYGISFVLHLRYEFYDKRWLMCSNIGGPLNIVIRCFHFQIIVKWLELIIRFFLCCLYVWIQEVVVMFVLSPICERALPMACFLETPTLVLIFNRNEYCMLVVTTLWFEVVCINAHLWSENHNFCHSFIYSTILWNGIFFFVVGIFGY